MEPREPYRMSMAEFLDEVAVLDQRKANGSITESQYSRFTAMLERRYENSGGSDCTRAAVVEQPSGKGAAARPASEQHEEEHTREMTALKAEEESPALTRNVFKLDGETPDGASSWRTRLLDADESDDGWGSGLSIAPSSGFHSARGINQVCDDVLGEIFLYIDENDSRGRQTLTSVSGVSQQWRSVANRLPQWSALVQARQLPCPGHNRADYLGTRDEVFAPARFIQEKQRHDDACCCRHVLFFLAALFLGLVVFVLSVTTLATNYEWPHIPQNKGLSSIIFQQPQIHNKGGALYLHIDYTKEARLETIIDNCNGSNSVTGQALALSFQGGGAGNYYRTGYPYYDENRNLVTHSSIESWTLDQTAAELQWMCPQNEDFTHTLKTLPRVEYAAAILTAIASIPTAIFLLVFLRTMPKRRGHMALVAAAVLLAVVLTVGFCMLIYFEAALHRLTVTPCGPGHPIMTQSLFKRNGDILIALIVTSMLLLILPVGMVWHAVSIRRLSRGEEEPWFEQHETLVRHFELILEYDAAVKRANAHSVGITRFVIEAAHHAAVQSDDASSKVEYGRVIRVDRRSLTVVLADGTLVDNGSGRVLAASPRYHRTQVM